MPNRLTGTNFMHCNLCGEKMPNCDCTDAERRMHSENERLKEVVNGMEAAAETAGLLYRNTDSGPNFTPLDQPDALRVRLNDAEREAVGVAIQCVSAARAQRHPEEEDARDLLWKTICALRGLLYRTQEET